MLRFFRHGDGGLALFNGSWEGERSLMDLVLARSGSSEARAGDGAGKRLPAAGRRHLAGDRRCRQPARPRHGRHRPCRHAVSFEMSAAHERLIVNCGTYPGAPREWRHFMRFTAAHSTAVVDDTNSTEITDHGVAGISRRQRAGRPRRGPGRAVARHEP